MPFVTNNISICQNDAQIDLSRGYNSLTFKGKGIGPDEVIFNPINVSVGDNLITRMFLDSMRCISNDSLNIEVSCAQLKEKAERTSKECSAHIAFILRHNLNANYSMWYKMKTKDSFVHTKVSDEYRLKDT